jgi:exodeoxyribonuclease VII large subunit
MERRRDSLRRLGGQLAHLNPTAVLARGYSITRRQDGRVVRTGTEIQVEERLCLTFAAGSAQVRVEETKGS